MTLDKCRSDERCQQAIDYGVEAVGACPVGKCAQPLAARVEKALVRLVATEQNAALADKWQTLLEDVRK